MRSYSEALHTFVTFCALYDGKLQIHEIGAKFINRYIMYYVEKLAARDLETGRIPQNEYDAIMEKYNQNFGPNGRDTPIPARYQKTLQHRLTVLKSFLRFISMQNKDGHDFTRIFPQVAKASSTKNDLGQRYLSENQLAALVSTAYEWPAYYKTLVGSSGSGKGREFVAWRNSLLMLIYALTAMRASEALHLKLEDFEPFTKRFENGHVLDLYAISVKEAKGGRARKVVAPTKFLKKHLDRMHHYFHGDKTRYIASRTPVHNEPISYTALYNYSKWIYQAAGMDDMSGFHCIRRGWATREIGAGKPPALVSKQLGHKSFTTTHTHYVITNDELLAKLFMADQDTPS
ncbi:tyrosine-type recombinase/integrase [Hydrogenimonas cancrithermarum]|uniref:Tyr recombinase domain-containing protein n=1 Tax=Hydrogenimonas cancrithermarum TaxID=2993563 RepID=A0ABM8FNN6_9BACT|nr:tyrosine-type recombinase/integrase [Hydrogenimonas cancrithermarum]BDY14011.1 hypothetical protein HCR_23240 [Hydrogenimonas cancrithermarum]